MRGFVLALVFLAPGLHAWSRLSPGTPFLDQLPYKDLLLCMPVLLQCSQLRSWSDLAKEVAYQEK